MGDGEKAGTRDTGNPTGAWQKTPGGERKKIKIKIKIKLENINIVILEEPSALPSD
jgi:hypothetical protein